MNNFLKILQVSRSIFHSTARAKHGQSMLLMVLVITGTLLSVAMISGLVMLFQVRQSGDFTNSAKAIFAAETGAEWWRMSVQKPSPSLPTITEINNMLKADNGSSFEVFTPVDGDPNKAKVVGTAGNSKRALLVTVQVTKGLLTCDTEQKVDLVMIFDIPSNQGNTDSVKSAAQAFIGKIMNPPSESSNVHIGVIHVGNFSSLYQLNSDQGNVASYISNLPFSSDPFALHLGLADAISELKSPRDRIDSENPDVILIITDSYPSNYGSAASAATTAKNSESIKIYVVNIGGSNSADMEALSSGVGYYFEPGNFSDLQTTLVDDLLGCPASP